MTSVVQEAFQEGIVNNNDDSNEGDDENVDTYERKLVEAVSRIDDLTQLCSNQDTEVNAIQNAPLLWTISISLCTY